MPYESNDGFVSKILKIGQTQTLITGEAFGLEYDQSAYLYVQDQGIVLKNMLNPSSIYLQFPTGITSATYTFPTGTSTLGASTLSSTGIISALGYTPYSSTNPNGYITGYTLTSSGITTALGFTPENNSNKVQDINNPNTNDYPSTLAVYNEIFQQSLMF